jgi:predicted permease
LIGRLRKGTSAALAQQQVDAVALHYRGREGRRTARKIVVTPLEELIIGRYRKELEVLFLAFSLALLIACINAANLLMTRAVARRSEIALRLALGASRKSLLWQMVGENSILAALGGLGSILLAFGGLHLFLHFLPSGFLPFEKISMGCHALGFAAMLSVACCMIFAVLPLWDLSDARVHEMVGETGRGQSESRSARSFRRGCVVAQVFCATVLLLVFGLLLRTFARLSSVQPGFDAQGVMVANLTVPRPRSGASPNWKTFASEVVARLKRQPGVMAAAVALSAPGGFRLRTSYGVEGRQYSTSMPLAEFRPIGVHYFSLLGIPLIFGRTFQTGDNSFTHNVCIVNKVLARQQFGGKDPIGANLKPIQLRPCEIVGVVEDVRSDGLSTASAPTIYVPFAQFPGRYIQFFLTFLVRSPRPVGALERAIRRTIWESDPALPVSVKPMRLILDSSIAPQRFRSLLMGIVSALALILVLAGIYGLLAYSVVRRRREIAIRMALGASPGRVFQSVIAEALKLTSWGALSGALASFPLAHLTRSLLSGITSYDPPTYMASVALIFVTAFLAAVPPAMRAMSSDPSATLRSE